MRVLLDTHVYLWWLADDPRLGPAGRALLADPTVLVYVSAASIWEASIKHALGRLELGTGDLVGEIEANGFFPLAVDAEHAWHAGQLPPHHDDPFDRLLVAQGQLAQLRLVTADVAVQRYDIDVVVP